MQTTDSPKRPLVHPSAGAKGTVRVGCVLGIQGALQRGQEPLHVALRPHSTTSRDAARLAEPCCGLCIAKPRCTRKPSCAGSFAEPLKSKARRLALPPQLLAHSASAGWRVMCRKAEGRRTMAAELTFEAICTTSRNAATLADNGSRSLMLSDGLAQICALARHAVPALLALLRALLRDLENLSGAPPGAQIFQVRRAASDAREHSVYRKTVLTRIEQKRQHRTTYGWTRPRTSEKDGHFSLGNRTF